MTGTVGIIGTTDRQIEDLVRATGMRAIALQPDDLANGRPGGTAPDVVVVDVRSDRRLLSSISAVKRRFPAMGVAIVVPALDPELMLEAMRAGVTECLTEPLTQGALEAAITRVMTQLTSPIEGRVFAVIGAKGGVGTTTIAVSFAEVLTQLLGDSLLVDFNVGTGDSAIFLGVEPRFGVVEALENTHRLDESFFRNLVVRTRSGLDLLGPSDRPSAGGMDLQRVRSLITFLVRYYRAVVLDVPRTDVSALDALEAASSIFVMVNQELATIRGAYRLVARLRQRYGSDRIGLLVNRYDKKSDISLADIEKAVNAKVRHTFPGDYKAAIEAVNHGKPVARSNNGKLPAAIHELGRMVTGRELEPPPSEQGGRMFGWLTPRRSQSE